MIKEISNIKQINRTILEVSYKHKLSHLSSCLTAAPIIEEIYQKKKDWEPFILSSGHAGVGLYAVLEQYWGSPRAEDIFLDHGIHPELCMDCHLDCSTGSLGQGLPIAVGMALAQPENNVYCLISDGECAEGSIWEALRIKCEQGLDNLKVYANLNGFSAYRRLDRILLANRLKVFTPDIKLRFNSNPNLSWLQGVNGHYQVMNEEMYNEALEKLT